MEHADEDEGTEPLPTAPPMELSDVTVGLLGVALVAFLVYTFARTAK